MAKSLIKAICIQFHFDGYDYNVSYWVVAKDLIVDRLERPTFDAIICHPFATDWAISYRCGGSYNRKGSDKVLGKPQCCGNIGVGERIT